MQKKSYRIKYQLRYSSEVIVEGISHDDALCFIKDYADEGGLAEDLKKQISLHDLQFVVCKINPTKKKPDLFLEEKLTPKKLKAIQELRIKNTLKPTQENKK